MLVIKNIKSAIFDIDGTLLDSMIIWDDLCSRYLKKLGVRPEADIDKIVANMSVKECASFIIDRYRLTISEEEFSKGALDIIDSFYREEVRLKSGVKQLVKSLYEAGIPMILVTTADKEQAKAALSRHGIFDYFKALITCNEYDTNKGESYIFKEALKIMAVDEEGVYVFEDSATAIKTAAALGYTTVGIKDKSGIDSWKQLEKYADFVVDELDDITI